MKARQDRISAEYASVAAAFLAGQGEAGLERGYDLGRKAIGEHLGLLQIVDIYTKALNENLKRLSPESANMMMRMTELLSATLAPFEMTHRGYQDSVVRLEGLNQELEHRTSELTEANHELESFSYSVSHDLRAPLRGIAGFSQIILQDSADTLDESGKENLNRVVASTKRMETLIDDMLELSRMSRTDLLRKRVDLGGLAKSIVKDLQESCPLRRAEILVSEGLVAWGDPNLLRIALVNLLGNAWKYTGKAPNARIEFGAAADEDGGTVFFVKDNGAGFDMAHTGRLFGAFQRLHSASEFEGTGIGLAIVQRIVRRHGGRIWAESAVENGATFYFTLPHQRDLTA
jgi:light-regulated signal transduction histidine kinase (bacteriophytochrome)